MTVSELIERLQALPQDMTVVSYEPPCYAPVDMVEVVHLVEGMDVGLVDSENPNAASSLVTDHVWVGTYG